MPRRARTWLIEVKTMRMKGHAQHDPAEYVPKEMFEYWKARDPIARYEKYLTENKLWDAKKKIGNRRASIERELDEDQKFAEESPLPPPETCRTGSLLQRLPYDRSGLEAAEERSDAAAIERASRMGSGRFGALTRRRFA